MSETYVPYALHHQVKESLLKVKQEQKMLLKIVNLGFDFDVIRDFKAKYLQQIKNDDETDGILLTYQAFLQNPPASLVQLSTELKQKLEEDGISIQLLLDKMSTNSPEFVVKEITDDLLNEPLPDKDCMMVRFFKPFLG